MEPTGEKKYGLIIPTKKNARPAFGLVSKPAEAKPKVFQDSSSSDDDLEKSDEDEGKVAMDWRARTVAKATEKSMQRNQARQAALKALEEDPTVFQYDEHYDEMERKKAQQMDPGKKEERKAKYIDSLLKTAEARKIEFERRTERKVQKEREKEGDMFSDKEAFVTPAYRAKLAELKKNEEEEERRDRIEAMLDVTKQKDLGGIQRHLFQQRFGEEKPKQQLQEPKEQDEPSEQVSTIAKEPAGQKPADFKVRRHYRQRREESPEPAPAEAPAEAETDSDEAEEPTGGKGRTAASAALVAAAARDRAAVADRDRAALADRDRDTQTDRNEQRAVKKVVKKEPLSDSDEESAPNDSPQRPATFKEPKIPKDVVEKKKVEEPKAKIDIWKKRHTDRLFEEARERFWQRREERQQGLVAWP